MTWKTVPCCWHCWSEREGARTPVRMREPMSEPCAFCMTSTKSGIYVRANIDPTTGKEVTE